MSNLDRDRRRRRRPPPTWGDGTAAPTPPAVSLPDVLTVEEAARYLRIGRASAYELARRYRETDGREGLPVVVLGRSLRVPRHALEQLLALGRPPGGDGARRDGRGRA